MSTDQDIKVIRSIRLLRKATMLRYVVQPHRPFRMQVYGSLYVMIDRLQVVVDVIPVVGEKNIDDHEAVQTGHTFRITGFGWGEMTGETAFGKKMKQPIHLQEGDLPVALRSEIMDHVLREIG